jgi:predicted DNA-binding transcriptional regulator AlpA
MAERKAILVLRNEEGSFTIDGAEKASEFLGVSRRSVYLHLRNEKPINGWHISYHPTSPEHTNRPANLYRVTNWLKNEDMILRGRTEVARYTGMSEQTVYTVSKSGKPSRSGWMIKKLSDKNNEQRRLYA